MYRPLHDGWSVAAAPATVPPGLDAPVAADRPVPATVPGCVYTDLLAAGLIDDPCLADNEDRLAWIGRTDWVYETTFARGGDRPGARGRPGAAERVDLVCRGLDTVATITLNDVGVGQTANMHRSYRFDVTPLLRAGNRLSVRFSSAYRYAEAVRDAVGERPGPDGRPYQYLRKMACNFGWDWGPALVTAGIWQPIGLHTWSTARLAEVRPLVTVAGGWGSVDVHVTLERTGDTPLTVVAEVAGVRREVPVPEGATAVTVPLRVRDPCLWWPRGYGGQPRYPLTVRLHDATSTLDGWTRRIGFRSVRLETGEDADGSAYTIVVNDVPVFVRGANWIPDDCFPTRVDRARYAARIGQAAAAGVNFLRVWGGGRYESEDFYDLADAGGLLVGQDFLFACAAYPEEEPLAGEVAAEAREQVARLAPHPSLAVWTGNNETLWGFADWGWGDALAGRTWGSGYYHGVLPAIVAELDPTRPYWAGSPYSGDPAAHPNTPHRGTVHIWDVWNSRDYRHYRSYRPRFVSEFGFQGPPAYATLRRALGEEALVPGSAGLDQHQKQTGGDATLLARLDGHLPVPETFDDWHFATQLNQARAVRFGIEHFRSLRPVCSGTIVWQLNDCWPVISWSAVDGDGRLKPVWYALRRAYADRLLTIQPRGGGLALVAVNDSGTPWTDQVDVVRRAFAGGPLATATVALDVGPGGASTVALPGEVAVPGDPAAELIVAGDGPGRALWFFAEDVDLALPRPRYAVRARPAAEGYRVAVVARTLLRDLALFPDRLDPSAEVDDALVTLLPGESAVFTIRCGIRLDPVALTTP